MTNRSAPDSEPAATRPVADGHERLPFGDTDGGMNGIVVFYAAQSFQEVPEIRVPKRGEGSKAYGLLTTSVARALGPSAGERPQRRNSDMKRE